MCVAFGAVKLRGPLEVGRDMGYPCTAIFIFGHVEKKVAEATVVKYIVEGQGMST